jgi:hypothetical protein
MPFLDMSRGQSPGHGPNGQATDGFDALTTEIRGVFGPVQGTVPWTRPQRTVM